MNEPVIERAETPEHGPDFWDNLSDKLVGDTRQMPAAAPTPIRPPSPKRDRRLWPMAAAAAVLALVGFGALISRGGNDPSTEVVAGPTTVAEASAAALDGPTDEDADIEADPGEAEPADSNDVGDTETSDAANAETETTESVETTTDADATSAPATTTTLPTADTAVAPLLVFDAALGAVGDTQYPPLDQGVPASATFLGTWADRQLSWYAVTDPSGSCQDEAYAEIRFVNPSGITQLVRDPQLYFSGEISHFTVHPERDLAAWVVSCGQQIELHVASLTPTGEVQDIDMVWFDEGSISSALVTWQGDEVSLNAIDTLGTPFFIDYSIVNRIPSRNDGPSRIMLEAGAPGRRSLVTLAANADASRTYWAGRAPSGTLSACPEDFGSDIADTLWLRSGEGQWQLAVADETPLAAITAMAIEPEFNQVAFADLCEGEVGRLFVGTVRADGLLSNLREIDLAPYVPGFAAELFWADPQTLRIETDNTEYGFGTVRFDFRFDDGSDQGILVQLD